MEQSTLAEILGVEKDLRAQLDAEREAANRWLENERLAIEQAHQAELARLQSEAQRRREAALGAARDEAAAIVRRAEATARLQAGAGDDDLRPLVRRRLAGIVPEEAR